MRILAGLLVMLLALPGAAAAQSDPSLDELTQDYQAAWNAGDARRLASLYAQNAMRLRPDGSALAGRAAIEQTFVKNFQGPWKGTKLTLKVGRTQEVAPNVRIQDGSYEISGGPGGTLRGRYLNTAVREGGAWKLASVAPIPEAALLNPSR